MRTAIMPVAMSVGTTGTHMIAMIENLFLLRRQRVIERLKRRLLRRQIGETMLQHVLFARLTLENAVVMRSVHTCLACKA